MIEDFGMTKDFKRLFTISEYYDRDRPAFYQAKAIGYILERGSLTIREFEGLCPEVNRRSLQRDLKVMVDMGLLVSEGATNKLVYRVKDTA